MLVSVIIPAYNRAAVLSRAISSVLAQTFGDYEVLVIDDASNSGDRYQFRI
jgi:glycosyltransferase involved in cell wall biosynthesis